MNSTLLVPNEQVSVVSVSWLDLKSVQVDFAAKLADDERCRIVAFLRSLDEMAHRSNDGYRRIVDASTSNDVLAQRENFRALFLLCTHRLPDALATCCFDAPLHLYRGLFPFKTTVDRPVPSTNSNNVSQRRVPNVFKRYFVNDDDNNDNADDVASLVHTDSDADKSTNNSACSDTSHELSVEFTLQNTYDYFAKQRCDFVSVVLGLLSNDECRSCFGFVRDTADIVPCDIASLRNELCAFGTAQTLGDFVACVLLPLKAQHVAKRLGAETERLFLECVNVSKFFTHNRKRLNAVAHAITGSEEISRFLTEFGHRSAAVLSELSLQTVGAILQSDQGKSIIDFIDALISCKIPSVARALGFGELYRRRCRLGVCQLSAVCDADALLGIGAAVVSSAPFLPRSLNPAKKRFLIGAPASSADDRSSGSILTAWRDFGTPQCEAFASHVRLSELLEVCSVVVPELFPVGVGISASSQLLAFHELKAYAVVHENSRFRRTYHDFLDLVSNNIFEIDVDVSSSPPPPPSSVESDSTLSSGERVHAHQLMFEVLSGTIDDRVLGHGEVVVVTERDASPIQRSLINWSLMRVFHPNVVAVAALPIWLKGSVLPTGMLTIDYIGVTDQNAYARLCVLLADVARCRASLSLAAAAIREFLVFRMQGVTSYEDDAIKFHAYCSSERSRADDAVVVLVSQPGAPADIWRCLAPIRQWFGSVLQGVEAWKTAVNGSFHESNECRYSSSTYSVVNVLPQNWFSTWFGASVSLPNHGVLIACIPFEARDFVAKNRHVLDQFTNCRATDKHRHVLLLYGHATPPDVLADWSTFRVIMQPWAAQWRTVSVLLLTMAQLLSPLQLRVLRRLRCDFSGEIFKSYIEEQQTRLTI